MWLQHMQEARKTPEPIGCSPLFFPYALVGGRWWISALIADKLIDTDLLRVRHSLEKFPSSVFKMKLRASVGYKALGIGMPLIKGIL